MAAASTTASSAKDSALGGAYQVPARWPLLRDSARSLLCGSSTAAGLVNDGGQAWQDSRVGPLMLLDTALLYYRAFYGVPDKR